MIADTGIAPVEEKTPVMNKAKAAAVVERLSVMRAVAPDVDTQDLSQVSVARMIADEMQEAG